MVRKTLQPTPGIKSTTVHLTYSLPPVTEKKAHASPGRALIAAPPSCDVSTRSARLHQSEKTLAGGKSNRDERLGQSGVLSWEDLVCSRQGVGATSGEKWGLLSALGWLLKYRQLASESQYKVGVFTATATRLQPAPTLWKDPQTVGAVRNQSSFQKIMLYPWIMKKIIFHIGMSTRSTARSQSALLNPKTNPLLVKLWALGEQGKNNNKVDHFRVVLWRK